MSLWLWRMSVWFQIETSEGGGHIVFTPCLAEDEGVTQGLGSDKKGARILTH